MPASWNALEGGVQRSRLQRGLAIRCDSAAGDANFQRRLATRWKQGRSYPEFAARTCNTLEVRTQLPQIVSDVLQCAGSKNAANKFSARSCNTLEVRTQLPRIFSGVLQCAGSKKAATAIFSEVSQRAGSMDAAQRRLAMRWK